MRSSSTASDSKADPSRRADAEPGRDPGFGIYVHWPFCLSKCPYCDFNSHVREAVSQDDWCAALVAEVGHFAELTGGRDGGRTVTSLYFGGGTPSLMPPDTVAAVIAAVRAGWVTANNIEITLEANPGAAETAAFRGFCDAGVNRLSIGVQSLHDDALWRLGRKHSAAEALTAIERAKSVFGRVTFDLIYARPAQGLADWKEELTEGIALAGHDSGGHLSVYQLTLEPGTVFHSEWKAGRFTPLDEARAARMYEVTQEMLEVAGMPAYEISNHARPGLESRHNLTYWRYGDYAGIGPGAHGRLTLGEGENGGKRAFSQIANPESWLAAVQRQGHGTREDRLVDRDTRAGEMLMMGLRTREGVDLARFADEAGQSLEKYVDMAAVNRMIDGGFLEREHDALCATPAGRQRLNAVLAAILES